MEKMKNLKVAIVGATGAVGQKFVEILARHPWFEVAHLAASERSEGKTYGEACRWQQSSAMPERLAAMPVGNVSPRKQVDLVFSALSAAVAEDIELSWAASGVPVFSNARNHRMASDVPLLIPEVNADHMELVRNQSVTRKFPPRGFIVTNPNCSTTFLAMALAPLERAFGLQKASVVTLQAISGAGYPGLPSMDILGNVIPNIAGEEAKMEQETQKILGRMHDGAIQMSGVTVSAQVNRVPVQDGHVECVSFSLARPAKLDEIIEVLRAFRGEPQELSLPSAPLNPILVTEGEDRPQPRLDLYQDNVMSTLVGRIRPCPVLDYKMTVLGHNTIRGAAGGSVLNAELAVARGYIEGK